ncbi:MAG: hypothetical protein M1570_02160 [Chloroflexi bacterium]|nr:hypothetical protein [Chloroflexota bacterium]
MIKRNTLILLAIVAVITVAFVAKTMSDASMGNAITIRRVSTAQALNGKPGIEVEVSSKHAFPSPAAQAVMTIGSTEFKNGEYRNGDSHTLVFTLTLADFAAVEDQSRITVRSEPDTQGYWDFGFLEKNWVIDGK